jgi:hypothetical protein
MTECYHRPGAQSPRNARPASDPLPSQLLGGQSPRSDSRTATSSTGLCATEHGDPPFGEGGTLLLQVQIPDMLPYSILPHRQHRIGFGEDHLGLGPLVLARWTRLGQMPSGSHMV